MSRWEKHDDYFSRPATPSIVNIETGGMGGQGCMIIPSLIGPTFFLLQRYSCYDFRVGSDSNELTRGLLKNAHSKLSCEVHFKWFLC